MRTTILAAALAAALVSCTSVDHTATASLQTQVGPQPMLSVVKVNTRDGGHGSGVYIGNGIVITAAHVSVHGIKSLTTSTEREIENGVELLWQNPKYDVAAISVAPGSGVVPANLNCRKPVDGEGIVARGSPLADDFIAMRGYVAGGIRAKLPDWAAVFVADISIAGGISGGPVFDHSGDVIGIIVGGALNPIPHGENPQTRDDVDLSQTGISYAVPSTIICRLLGRV